MFSWLYKRLYIPLSFRASLYSLMNGESDFSMSSMNFLGSFFDLGSKSSKPRS